MFQWCFPSGSVHALRQVNNRYSNARPFLYSWLWAWSFFLFLYLLVSSLTHKHKGTQTVCVPAAPSGYRTASYQHLRIPACLTPSTTLFLLPKETLPLLLEPKRTGPVGGIFWYLPSLPLCHADGSSDDCHSGSPTSIYDSRRFVHSIADGHLGCHQSWAAVNIPVHVCSTCIHTLLHVYTLESGTTEPWSFHT